MAHRIIRYLFLATLLLLAVAIWRKDVLPESKFIQEKLLLEPAQQAIQSTPITTSVGEIEYKIQPLYEYKLYGLVVSRHDSDTWWDYIHKAANDKLNVADLCVIWGDNLHNESYRNIAFSSGQFTCNFGSSSWEVWEAFDKNAVSNNHLLTDKPALAKKIRNARIGDQIHVRGYLAEYSHNQGFPFKRGTSTTRTDTGNGACETIYVESFEILQRGDTLWLTLLRLAIFMLFAEVIAWFVIPMRVGD